MSASGGRMAVRSTAASGAAVYESGRATAEYLQFHFGLPSDLMPFSFGPTDALHFPARTADICRRYASSSASVLDVGCAVGGASFQLAKTFHRVVGIDFSQHFIDAAEKMRSERRMDYEMLKQGEVFVKRTAALEEGIDASRILFKVGDACSLQDEEERFDVVHASNLLCRLPKPTKFLADVPKLLKEEGILVLVSPYSWLEEYTAKGDWIGAKEESLDSAAELEKLLSSLSLKLVHSEDMPFLIREHERKFQYGVSHCSVWRKIA